MKFIKNDCRQSFDNIVVELGHLIFFGAVGISKGIVDFIRRTPGRCEIFLGEHLAKHFL